MDVIFVTNENRTNSVGSLNVLRTSSTTVDSTPPATLCLVRAFSGVHDSSSSGSSSPRMYVTSAAFLARVTAGSAHLSGVDGFSAPGDGATGLGFAPRNGQDFLDLEEAFRVDGRTKHRHE